MANIVLELPGPITVPAGTNGTTGYIGLTGRFNVIDGAIVSFTVIYPKRGYEIIPIQNHDRADLYVFSEGFSEKVM